MMQRTPIESVRAQAFGIPTDRPEADGTIGWNSTTTCVVEISAGGETGLGYTYSGLPLLGSLAAKLPRLLRGRTPSIRRPHFFRCSVRFVISAGRACRDRHFGGRFGYLRPQGSAPRPAAVCDAGQLSGFCADLRERGLHDLLEQGACRAARGWVEMRDAPSSR